MNKEPYSITTPTSSKYTHIGGNIGVSPMTRGEQTDIVERRPYTKHGLADQWLTDHVNWTGDECLIWPFRRNEKGYPAGGKHRRMHREMCIAAHGDAPTPNHEVAHTCGNGHLGCINPRHLAWKTHRENLADKVIHGTATRGSSHPTSKLSEEQVRQIKSSPPGYGQNRKFAAMFGVSPGTIASIRSGTRWGHLQ